MRGEFDGDREVDDYFYSELSQLQWNHAKKSLKSLEFLSFGIRKIFFAILIPSSSRFPSIFSSQLYVYWKN